MKQFEKMVNNLFMYEKHNKELANLKQENKLKEKQLAEQFEILKNTCEQNFKKEVDLILKEQEKLKTKKINLKQELTDIKAEDISQEFLSYINNAIRALEKEMQKNDEKIEELKNNLNITFKQYQKELNSKRSELNKQEKRKETLLKNSLDLLKENESNIVSYELEAFLARYLKQTTGKDFIKMDDETAYKYEYYEEYSTCCDYFHFIGLKCANKTFKTFEELLEGINNKEVILLDIKEERHFTNDHKLFSLEENYHFEKFKSETKITNVPYFSFLQNENLENSYFKIYPDLKEKLLNYIEKKFIKEEKTELEKTEKYINNLKNEIDTNEQQMKTEIDNMLIKIKDKYSKKLKDDKVEYFEITNKYSKQKEEFEASLNKKSVIKIKEKLEQGLEK